MKIVASRFQGFGMIGDFDYMIKLPEYADTLFIFNDDIESIHKYNKGKGNAIIRPYNKYNPAIKIPRSAGIPTGTRVKNQGFKRLDDTTKIYIDDAIENIKNLIKQYNYNKIVFSANSDGNLGSGIFKIDQSVINYITEQIKMLEIL